MVHQGDFLVVITTFIYIYIYRSFKRTRVFQERVVD